MGIDAAIASIKQMIEAAKTTQKEMGLDLKAVGGNTYIPMDESDFDKMREMIEEDKQKTSALFYEPGAPEEGTAGALIDARAAELRTVVENAVAELAPRWLSDVPANDLKFGVAEKVVAHFIGSQKRELAQAAAWRAGVAARKAFAAYQFALANVEMEITAEQANLGFTPEHDPQVEKARELWLLMVQREERLSHIALSLSA